MGVNKPVSKIIKIKQPLAAVAYDAIYQRIVSLKYEPGQRLEENLLVAELGIGRTPVREALLSLASDLLVESQPNKGFIVRPITLQNTKSAFEALEVFELGAAGLAVRQDVAARLDRMEKANQDLKEAVQRMDVMKLVATNSEFHSQFARCSRNIYIVQGLQKVRCETNRLAYLSYGNEIEPCKSLQDHYASVIRQHGRIIKYIRERKETRLKETLSEHIQTFKKRVIHYLAS